VLLSQVVKWGFFCNSSKYRPPTKDFSCSLEVARFQEWIFMTPTDSNFYKVLLDHMSDGVYFVDLNRRIQYWNEGAYRLTGYKAEELVGRSCQDDTLCHVDGTGRRLCLDGCPLQASMKDGSPHEAHVFLRHKQGRRVPVAVRVQPLRTADGSIIGR
jgi:PAS domain S-box-containing protein